MRLTLRRTAMTDAKLETYFTAIKGDFNRVDDRFDRVDADIAELKGDMKVVKGDVFELKRDMVTVKSDLVEIKGKMNDFIGIAKAWDIRDRHRETQIISLEHRFSSLKS